jgi:hypothetical protein
LNLPSLGVYTGLANEQKALETFRLMESHGIQADASTYSRITNMFAKLNRVEHAEFFYERLKEKFDSSTGFGMKSRFLSPLVP